MVINRSSTCSFDRSSVLRTSEVKERSFIVFSTWKLASLLFLYGFKSLHCNAHSAQQNGQLKSRALNYQIPCCRDSSNHTASVFGSVGTIPLSVTPEKSTQWAWTCHTHHHTLWRPCTYISKSGKAASSMFMTPFSFKLSRSNLILTRICLIKQYRLNHQIL